MARPIVLRSAFSIRQIGAPGSLDFEYSPRTNKPTILGLSDLKTTVSVPFDEGWPQFLEWNERNPQADIIAYNYAGAEDIILREQGIQIAPERIQDGILWHYLLNMNLCKAAKQSEDDDGDLKGRGFMNLFACVSIYTDCDQWKMCCGEEQCLEERRPCPEHQPFLYNGEDCYRIAEALPKMRSIARMRGVDKLYPLHRDLSLVLQRVKERGVLVDKKHIESLRADFQADKQRIDSILPFNLRSSPQVKKYFCENKIPIENAQEKTLREALEDFGLEDIEEGDSEFQLLPLPQQHLILSVESKGIGNGPDRWFAPRSWNYETREWEGFVDEDDFIHCSLGPYTSTGRFNCKGPNLQNVAKRRKDRRTGESLGKKIRRAIIAPDGYYLYRADYKAAEYRTFLTLAGYRNIPTDREFHEWMAGLMGLTADDEFAMSLGGPKDAAKSVNFGTIYLEGLKLAEPKELHKPRFMNEVAKGARLVFPDWKVFGKIVTFTGINLAKRALGGATLENRAIALSYVQRLFKEFPLGRALQIKQTLAVERNRAVITETGYCCLSYGYEEKRLKTAAAMHGSNPVAQFIKYAMINADKHPMLGKTNVLSVHDELLFYVDCRHEPAKVKEWIQEVMVFNLPEIPELKIPIDCSYGRNWADTAEIS